MLRKLYGSFFNLLNFHITLIHFMLLYHICLSGIYPTPYKVAFSIAYFIQFANVLI